MTRATETARRGLASPAVLYIAVGTSLAAWIGLVAWGHWGHSSTRGPLDHTVLAESGEGAALLLVAWTVMVLAMMLPPAVPFLHLVERLVQDRRSRGWLVLAAATGFLLPWIVTGQAFQAIDVVVHGLVDRSGWLRANENLVAGAVLTLAGAFQFSRLKRRCLNACRSPLGFAARWWRGERGAGAEALTLGAAYGVSCVGCCWALMLVTFATATASVWWMLGLSAVMAAERLAPGGTRLTAPVGAALLAAGILVALA